MVSRSILGELENYFKKTCPQKIKEDWEATINYDEVDSPKIKNFYERLKEFQMENFYERLKEFQIENFYERLKEFQIENFNAEKARGIQINKDSSTVLSILGEIKKQVEEEDSTSYFYYGF